MQQKRDRHQTKCKGLFAERLQRRWYSLPEWLGDGGRTSAPREPQAVCHFSHPVPRHLEDVQTGPGLFLDRGGGGYCTLSGLLSDLRKKILNATMSNHQVLTVAAAATFHCAHIDIHTWNEGTETGVLLMGFFFLGRSIQRLGTLGPFEGRGKTLHLPHLSLLCCQRRYRQWEPGETSLQASKEISRIYILHVDWEQAHLMHWQLNCKIYETDITRSPQKWSHTSRMAIKR